MLSIINQLKHLTQLITRNCKRPRSRIKNCWDNWPSTRTFWVTSRTRNLRYKLNMISFWHQETQSMQMLHKKLVTLFQTRMHLCAYSNSLVNFNSLMMCSESLKVHTQWQDKSLVKDVRKYSNQHNLKYILKPVVN